MILLLSFSQLLTSRKSDSWTRPSALQERGLSQVHFGSDHCWQQLQLMLNWWYCTSPAGLRVVFGAVNVVCQFLLFLWFGGIAQRTQRRYLFGRPWDPAWGRIWMPCWHLSTHALRSSETSPSFGMVCNFFFLSFSLCLHCHMLLVGQMGLIWSLFFLFAT